MADVALSEVFLAKIAGWDVVKQARAIVASGKVLSGDWSPPTLKGIVQDGSTSYRAGLLIKDSINIENLCTCRASRSWGTICAHSIAVGIFTLQSGNPTAVQAVAANNPLRAGAPKSPALQRRGAAIVQSESGDPLSICTIFPPNLPDAIMRGKVMLCFEGQIGATRAPLNSFISKGACALSHGDAELLARLETLAGGDTPAMMALTLAQLVELLPFIQQSTEARVGRNQPITFGVSDLRLKLKATLESSGE
ncbi:MAG: rapA, partial [Verrucomicrobiales bacterium]|nr:rapA [Verrucomicrobiales bacterium]